MFKGVDTSRSWPKTGMTSRDWRALDIETVRLRSLIATQDGVYFQALIDAAEPVGGDPYIHVIYWRGEYYLEDGHTRVMNAFLGWQDYMLGRILRIEEPNV